MSAFFLLVCLFSLLPYALLLYFHVCLAKQLLWDSVIQ